MKKNKGITLIALVVTIIVLLILAGVSIQMLTGQSGILKQAKEAKDKTEKAEIIENVQRDILEEMMKNGQEDLDKDQLYDILKNYFSNVPDVFKNSNTRFEESNEWKDFPNNFPPLSSKEGNYTIQIGDIFSGDLNDSKSNRLKIGDFINYTPDTASAYSKDLLTITYTGSDKNLTDITQEELKWQVLSVNDDGTAIDLIGTPTKQVVEFKNPTGYNNGVDIMNDICKTLYSKQSSNIVARSINIEDIEKHLTETGINNRNNYRWEKASGQIYNGTFTYKDDASYYPNIYKYEKGQGIEQEITSNNGLEELNPNGLSGSDSNKDIKDNLAGDNGLGYTQASNGILTTTQTGYVLPIDEINFGEISKVLIAPDYYWVASRATETGSPTVHFCLHKAGPDIERHGMFSSLKWVGYATCNFRPIVSLNSNVKLQLNDGTEENPHLIIEY